MEDLFETTEDLLLEKLVIVQDKRYYRFTSDSVLLSKFATAKNGDKVADFCAGSGIVALHFYGLNKDKIYSVTLFELQNELAALSRKSIAINQLNDIFDVCEGKLQECDKSYNGTFDIVLCNPPYKKKNSGEQGLSKHIAICRHEVEITLEEIVATAARVLKPKGRLCICQKPERLTDLMCLLRQYKLDPSRLQMVVTEQGGAPYLVMVEGIKGLCRQLKIEPERVNGK